MRIITTVTDLKNYLYDCRADLGAIEHGEGFDRAAEAIQSAEHPAWGSDWESWLEDHQDLIDEELESR
jgi:hypothetical protein